jgi:hypothetical protein
MNDLNREKFADELLDTAMAHYRGAEPQWGLEERILAHLRQRSRSRLWMWSKMGPSLAAMVTIAALSQVALRPVSHNAESQPAARVAVMADKQMTANETAKALPPRTSFPRPAKTGILSHKPARKHSYDPAPQPVQPAALPSEDDVQITALHVSDLKMTEIAISGSGRDD